MKRLSDVCWRVFFRKNSPNRKIDLNSYQTPVRERVRIGIPRSGRGSTRSLCLGKISWDGGKGRKSRPGGRSYRVRIGKGNLPQDSSLAEYNLKIILECK
ncbi:hypothetical protein [Candidatus Chlorohelix sp.]|uniref:hypothetical protein n=1 Tax=Candidatus Chlorohelix sp. TaxID=3139201 RepID=UPI00304302BE